MFVNYIINLHNIISSGFQQDALQNVRQPQLLHGQVPPADQIGGPGQQQPWYPQSEYGA